MFPIQSCFLAMLALVLQGWRCQSVSRSDGQLLDGLQWQLVKTIHVPIRFDLGQSFNSSNQTRNLPKWWHSHQPQLHYVLCWSASVSMLTCFTKTVSVINIIPAKHHDATMLACWRAVDSCLCQSSCQIKDKLTNKLIFKHAWRCRYGSNLDAKKGLFLSSLLTSLKDNSLISIRV